MQQTIGRIGAKIFHTIGWLVCVVLLLTITVMVTYQLAYYQVILPKVSISGIDVSNMDKETAVKRLATEFEKRPNVVSVVYRGEEVAETSRLPMQYDFVWAAEQAWSLGRGGNPLTKVSERIEMFLNGKNIELPIVYDADVLDGIITRVAERVNSEGVSPKIFLDENGEVRVETGKDGLKVDEEEMRAKIVATLLLPGNQTVEVKTKIESFAIDSAKITTAMETAKRWENKKLRLYYRDYSLTLTTEDILELISLANVPINETEADRFLVGIRAGVETEPKNAIFNFNEGKVIEFAAEVDGVKIDETAFKEKLAEKINLSDQSDLSIPVIVTQAKIKTGDINNLGINSLIGIGTSKFHHSIPNRVHNLSLASSRLNGALVAPGETFSLGKTIGDISRATGYREAYVISEGRTVLGDGGGVCQVSTTLFRAALNAGLPIVERKAHAYRVGYYEEDMGPGYDATVFFPSADLKFVNDTPGHILIQTKVDAKNFAMRYEIYGTGDGRKATVSKARISGQSSPLPTVYQDDPTLPVGTKKQVDWSAPGAKVSFDYKVVRNGETLQDRTFTSSYRPWAAVYLVGTGQLTASN